MTKPERISVIGSGLMGHGIAQIFALHGHQVTLYDIRQDFLDKALVNVKANLDAFAAKGIVGQAEADAAPSRIACTLSLEDAAKDADFIVEAVPEKMALKQDIFSKLDAMSKPTAVLASNTSVMSITEIASTSRNRARIVGTHFWNPPYLIPLVEVVQANETSLQTVEFTIDLLRRVGKHPVHCRKDVPGFIANRMQHALWREAVYIVEQGIAEPRTVDEAVRLSFGMRLPVLGPLENADMVGLDLTQAIHDYILPALCDSHETSPVIRDKVAADELGFKTGKGLQDWPADKQQDSRNALRDYLLNVAEKQAKSGQ